MMLSPVHPAIIALVEENPSDFLWLEVWVSRRGSGYELRHAVDSKAAASGLQALELEGLATWADVTEMGEFRPNKAAPGLRRGWRVILSDLSELDLALDALYPGTVTDWFAARSDESQATSFRDFASRQTGLYRNVNRLTDKEVRQVAAAVCDPRFCLRQRRWPVPGGGGETSPPKSCVPCWEPCALLLEFARRHQQLRSLPQVAVPLSAPELESLRALVGDAINRGAAGIREGDSSQPGNLRRLRLLEEQIRRAVVPEPS